MTSKDPDIRDIVKTYGELATNINSGILNTWCETVRDGGDWSKDSWKNWRIVRDLMIVADQSITESKENPLRDDGDVV